LSGAVYREKPPQGAGYLSQENTFMKILFCKNELKPGTVADVFAEEYNAAKTNSFNVLVYYFEEESIRKIEKMETGIYRGWMLSPVEYKKVYTKFMVKKLPINK
jgi:hypothetical protein